MRVRNVGIEQACLMLQSFALKTATVSHVLSDEFNKLRLHERQNMKEVESTRKFLAEHAQLLKDNESLRTQLAEQQRVHQEKEDFVKKQLEDIEIEWKKKIDEVRTALKSHEEKVASHEGTISEMKSSFEERQREMDKLCSAKDAEIEELRVDTVLALLKGFDKAKEQVSALYPSLVISELHRLKEVVDGKLVLVSTPENEDGEMHDTSDAA